MKISKVVIKDFKRFKNLTLDLGDNPEKIIALVGANGCGKSSVLDAFVVYNREFGGNIGNGYTPEIFYRTDNKKASELITIDYLDVGKGNFKEDLYYGHEFYKIIGILFFLLEARIATIMISILKKLRLQIPLKIILMEQVAHYI